jgi:RNA polymerase sigma factor (sigma-70 family)
MWAQMSVFRTQPGLLQAFRDGRRDALETVYRAHVRAIDRYLRALARASGNLELGQASSIADFLQEVFVRAFSAAGRRGYDGVRDYAPYLATIARNCFIDALRARGREVLTCPHDLPLTIDDDNVEAEGWCEPRTLAVLTAYVSALDEPALGVYEQRFVLGRSQEQASSALGLSRRAIRTAEEHLRRGLRKELARAGISLRELADARTIVPTSISASPAKEGDTGSSTRISTSAVRMKGES